MPRGRTGSAHHLRRLFKNLNGSYEAVVPTLFARPCGSQGRSQGRRVIAQHVVVQATASPASLGGNTITTYHLASMPRLFEVLFPVEIVDRRNEAPHNLDFAFRILPKMITCPLEDGRVQHSGWAERSTGLQDRGSEPRTPLGARKNLRSIGFERDHIAQTPCSYIERKIPR